MKKVLLTLFLSFALVGCVQGQSGEKCITVEIVYADEQMDEEIDFCTNSEFLLEALEEQNDELQLETNSSEFGAYVNGLKGYNFESLKLNYYWAIYVNSDYGLYGVAEQTVTDGDVFKFEATSW